MRSVTESVIGEISRSLDFFAATAAESRIARVYLSGGGSRVSGLDAAFQGKTNLPVERLNPLAKVVPSSKFDSDYLDEVGPSLAVSVGLALRRMDDR
jgi:type IV pilus assembly protein PilM